MIRFRLRHHLAFRYPFTSNGLRLMSTAHSTSCWLVTASFDRSGFGGKGMNAAINQASDKSARPFTEDEGSKGVKSLTQRKDKSEAKQHDLNIRPAEHQAPQRLIQRWRPPSAQPRITPPIRTQARCKWLRDRRARATNHGNLFLDRCILYFCDCWRVGRRFRKGGLT